MTKAAAELRFVVGKGGVGRTTVAAARAEQAAVAGRRTLAVDATGSGDLARLLDGRGSADGNDLTVLTLSTVEALDHYLSLFLPVPGFAGRVAGRAVGPGGVGPLARIFEYVATAAPGVREILMIGKIGWEALNGGWDDVVVDAPATGHVVELLDAPRAMAELVPVGPIADQSAWLQELLAGPTMTVELVTTLDELAVTESLELAARLRTETQSPVDSWVLNRVPPAVGPAGEAEAVARRRAGADQLAAVADLAVRRGRSAQEQRDRVASALSLASAPSSDRSSASAPSSSMITVVPETSPALAMVTAAVREALEGQEPSAGRSA